MQFPSEYHDGGNGVVVPYRFMQQKWLLDAVIETAGLDWDQLRRANTLGATGSDAATEYAYMEASITRFDEIGPTFAEMGRRRRERADEALAQGNEVTARENFFISAIYFGWAQWPLHDPSSPNIASWDRQKVDAFRNFASLSAHRVERLELSLSGNLLPAWLHMPPTDGGPLPVVILIPGMDTFKELQVAMYGDKFLERGFAVLAVDGPGQSEALAHGLTVTPTNFTEAADVWLDAIAEHPELDEHRVVVYGRSFGSYCATQIAGAHSDRLMGVAAALVIHEPGLHTLMEESAPSFKARFMYMAGCEEEDQFDDFVAGFVLDDFAQRIECPFLVVAGELDQLSPLRYTLDLMRTIPGPRELIVYEAERHAIGRSRAALHGPHWYSMIADWLKDRASGVDAGAADATYTYIAADGTLQDRSREL